MKSCTYRCIRCGDEFHAPSPEMSLLVSGQLVEHCEQRAIVVREREASRDKVHHDAPQGPITGLVLFPSFESLGPSTREDPLEATSIDDVIRLPTIEAEREAGGFESDEWKWGWRNVWCLTGTLLVIGAFIALFLG